MKGPPIRNLHSETFTSLPTPEVGISRYEEAHDLPNVTVLGSEWPVARPDMSVCIDEIHPGYFHHQSLPMVDPLQQGGSEGKWIDEPTFTRYRHFILNGKVR